VTTAPRDGSALCASCGLCCNGTIFENVPLTEPEVETARRLHLPVYAKGERFRFDLPCPRQEADHRCGVYEERPQICRSFVCETLAAYLAEELDLPAARARVELLRALAARVLAQLPPHLAGHGLWQATTLFTQEGEAAPDPAAWRAKHGAFLFDILELERMVRRDFVTRGR
jgi:Fe-S-cluster containining protein